jgi:hypothetical protein
MPVQPKINGEFAIKILKECYLDKKMSTTELANQSEKIFGIKVGASTIFKELVRNKIPVRSKSESVSRALSTLNIDETYLNEIILEWVDGFLLGDGGISFNNRSNFMGSRFQIGSSEQEWSRYAMSKFNSYGAAEPHERGKIDEKHPNKIWHSQTLTHPDIITQARRWYSGENWKKVIPPDVRITPTSILLWYLGDGSLTYIEESNTYVVRFATCAFSVEDVENILMPKLTRLGLECSRDESKNDIRIKAASIGHFFDIIGHKSPISCYDYKFDIPEWVRLIRLSDIVQNDKQRWMAQYYYKSGQLECSKSPGGRMLLFTKEQADKLRIKLQIS